MLQALILKIKGLFTHANDLSEVPVGALSVADNISIDRESIAQPRRGFDLLRHAGTASAFSDLSYRANKIWFYKDTPICHYSTNLLAYHDSTSGWTPLAGTFSPPSTDVKVKAIEANQNFYFATAAGVYKMDNFSTTPVLAGAPRGLDIQAVVSSSSTTWLLNNYKTAYRIVWGIKDSNQNLVIGSPSQRETYKNTTGATKAVNLTVTIPSGITTAWFYQVYRAAAVDCSVIDVDPNDTMGLVYESNPSAGDLIAGTVTLDDITPDALRGTTLYTSPSQEGPASGNLQPPLCKDAALFRDAVFYANTISKHRYTLTVVGTGSPNGVQTGDTITIGGVVYTADTDETTSTGHFRAYTTGTFNFTVTIASPGVFTFASHGRQNGDAVTLTTTGALPTGLVAGTTYYVINATTNTFNLAATYGGTAITTTGSQSGTHTLAYGGSASQNIHDTAVSLIRVINRYTSSTVNATYLSGPDDLPGIMLLEEKSIGGSAFPVISSRSGCWSPALPSSGTTQVSSNDAAINGLSYSKPFQPEHVPLTNTLSAGSKNKAILRVIPLRNKLMILKEDGCYVVSGYDAESFEIQQLDATAILIAPESAVVLNNQIYALTTQGVVAISDNGVQVVSRAIETTLLALQGQDISQLRTGSFAIGYESERKYILFCLSTNGDTSPTQAFVYNTFTNAWTRWLLSKTCGTVNPADDKLYLGDAGSPFINEERKSFRYTDFVDYGFSSTITNVATKTISLTQTDLISVGDVIYQSATVFSIVSSVDVGAGTVTTLTTASFVNGAVDVLKAIPTTLAWVPQTAGNPGILKQFFEASIIFRQDFNGTATLTFTSDVSPSMETETIQGTAVGLFGVFSWGGVPWGGLNKRRPYRVQVPRNKQRCSQLIVQFSTSTGYTAFLLEGISIQGTPGSSRTGRG